MTRVNPDSGHPSGAVVRNAQAFTRRYLAHAATQLAGHAQPDLAALARDALAFGASRPWAQNLLQVRDVDGATTAVDIVSIDAPYIVESLVAELHRSGRGPARVLHPQFVVHRDTGGALTNVFDIDDNADVPAGALVESWVHLELDLVPESEHEALAEALRGVLDDVLSAVSDAPQMYELIRSLADELEADPGEFDRETSEEAGALLRWLADGTFMILGHAEYSPNDLASPRQQIPDDVEGVLRGAARISPLELLPAFRSGAPLVIFKSPLVSTVRRSVHYDCVTVVTPSEGRTSQRIHVFLGLITNAEDDGTVGRIPVVRRRIGEILLRSGVRAQSHTGRRLLAALRTLPRDELLEAPTGDLLRLAQLLVDRADHRTVGVFARIHLNRDFVTVLVYFPADRLGPETRHWVTEIINGFWPGEIIGRDDRIVELDLARMHLLIAVRPGAQPPSPERSEVEAEVARAIRRWSDDFADLLTLAVGEDDAARLAGRYAEALPEAYKQDFGASSAVRDILRLEQLPADDGLAFDLYTPHDSDGADRRLKVFRTGHAVSLARALPVFTQMGIEVLDERPYELQFADGETVWIYDFGLHLPPGTDFDDVRARNMIDAVRLLWLGEIEQDGLNELVVRTAMTWWQINILRTYAKYLRQAGTTFSQSYLERSLVDNCAISQAIVELFESRFDPDRIGEAPLVDVVDGDAGGTVGWTDLIEAQLADVVSLDQDRILRSMLSLVNATLRTNAYRTDGGDRPAIAVKLDPRRIADLPQPRPRFEVWVYSPRVEGVHLRFGDSARGGVRWSDRGEDFRTEVLGLATAQTRKNSIIVPSGAAGAFFPKRLPDRAADRDAWLSEGAACYRTFVSCLLDVTDNYVTTPEGQRQIATPPRTRCYDTDDPYLLVAPDEGTEPFGDLANELADGYSFWLGDAFSGTSSAGYDQRSLGITARGAWRSAEQHFRALGIDPGSDEITVVGIGNMSSSAFGNGMMLSKTVRLVASFDQTHVFLDPEPDVIASRLERNRLFYDTADWSAYNTSSISSGGGVYSRAAKAIPVTAQTRRLLSLSAETNQLAPSEVIRAILRSHVDLLWMASSGTYVKASTESHRAARDPHNDAARVNGAELGASIVVEAADLGLTQRGRVEFALRGGLIHNDAIDNAAGVAVSDREVNLKILLADLEQAGLVSSRERASMVAAARDEVVERAINDCADRSVALWFETAGAAASLSADRRLLASLESIGELDRTVEGLPDDRELAARAAVGTGLTAPEYAVLLAHVRRTLGDVIEDSTVPDEPWFQQTMVNYFPSSVRYARRHGVPPHPVERQIVASVLVNELVALAGTTFVHRMTEQTGMDTSQILRAFIIVREVFGLGKVWAAVAASERSVALDDLRMAFGDIRSALERATRWLLAVRFPITDIASEIERFSPVVTRLAPRMRTWLAPDDRPYAAQRESAHRRAGLTPELAAELAGLREAPYWLGICEVAYATDADPARVADVYFAALAETDVERIIDQLTSSSFDGTWTSLAHAELESQSMSRVASIVTVMMSTSDLDAPISPRRRVHAWLARAGGQTGRFAGLHEHIRSKDEVGALDVFAALDALYRAARAGEQKP